MLPHMMPFMMPFMMPLLERCRKAVRGAKPAGEVIMVMMAIMADLSSALPAWPLPASFLNGV